MPIVLEWKCPSPIDGLLDAMERLALEVAEEGEYYQVWILSTPKTMTGGKYANAHFKVKLFGNINGRAVVHQHCIYIEHRSAYGRHDYVMARDERDENYPYTTLVAVGGPPSSCPMRRRLQREQQEAAALPDGWYADPWAAESGKAQRYWANGQWTTYTR
ncbi:hypothetical protein A9K55_006819 [Cordyceps militaris]|uniref:DUF2510 domain-containing protein n=1 Tax=Cordyceps militaris TaxID=73501 RepID=A0A2H4SB73_CORMI|nr:hypothetical protein A9K55_006819 [Cordyceps militaris]